jgi:hypothetical protein
MRTRNRTSRTGRKWVLSVLAVLSMAAQLVLAIAPLTEGTDQRMASHVEAAGTQTHYAHNEATCASCQARSIHGSVPRPSPVPLEAGGQAFIVVVSVDRSISVDAHSPSSPRAPPSLI